MLESDASNLLQLRRQRSVCEPITPNNLTTENKKLCSRKVPQKKTVKNRELFNLLVHQGKDNKPPETESFMPSHTKRGYTSSRPLLGLTRRARRWKWKTFVNHGRNDDLQLLHWEREDGTHDVYPFSRFNKTMEPTAFTNSEYEEYLVDPRWTMEETRHLLELCHRFDLRWPIIEDRFDRILYKGKKTMEDMKDRYYNLLNGLNNARKNSSVQPFYYDADSERRRKEQLIKLWNRTPEQVKEEEDLRAEIKRIEAKKKERERRANEVQRLINSTDKVTISPEMAFGSTVGSLGTTGISTTSARSRRLMKMKSGQHHMAQIISDAQIRWPMLTSPGPHLRSQEMKIPSNLGQRKLKNIDVVVDKLKLDLYPDAFEEVVHAYNQFRSNILVLQDFKAALHGVECEIDQIAHRLQEEKNIIIHIDPRFRVSEAFYSRVGSDVVISAEDSESTEHEQPKQELRGDQSPTSVTQQQGSKTGAGKGKGKTGARRNTSLDVAPVTSRRIARLIDINPIGSTSSVNTRKRRNVTSPTANAQQKAGEGFITESQQMTMTTDSTERSSSQRD